MNFRVSPVQAAAVVAGLLSLSAQAATVARDAGGALRTPTADEATALTAAKPVTPPLGLISGRVNPQAVVHANGTVEQELTTESLTYSVARRNPDGSIEMVCVTGQDAANKALKAPSSFAKRVSPKTKEVANDR